MSEEHDPDGAAWPQSPHTEWDGFLWEVSPDEPTEEDREWAANNLNDAPDAPDVEPPDEHYDALAAEDEAIERLERGLL